MRYASGAVERFDARVPLGPWPELVYFLPYGPDAVDGPATAWFKPRPEGADAEDVSFEVDLDRMVDLEFTVRWSEDIPFAR